MRKYRGLTKKGKWVYGYYIQMVNISIILPADYLNNDRYSFYGLDEEDNVFEMSSECIEVIPETVGQFTGLKDKKSKEGYASDIVSFGSTRPLYLIKWSICNAGFYLASIDKQKERLGISNFTVGEIIGNIHQNPELLEKDNGCK